jgi:hypothetical protein
MLKTTVICTLGIILAVVLLVVQLTSIGDLRRSKDSYKEKYEVAISQRDFYKRQVEWKSGFDVEATLSDGITMSIRVNYQEGYPMSVEQRLRMTVAMRDALSSEKVFPPKPKE